MDRLGVAKGLEALIRGSNRDWQPSAAAIMTLRGLLALPDGRSPQGGESPLHTPAPAESQVDQDAETILLGTGHGAMRSTVRQEPLAAAVIVAPRADEPRAPRTTQPMAAGVGLGAMEPRPATMGCDRRRPPRPRRHAMGSGGHCGSAPCSRWSAS